MNGAQIKSFKDLKLGDILIYNNIIKSFPTPFYKIEKNGNFLYTAGAAARGHIALNDFFIFLNITKISKVFEPRNYVNLIYPNKSIVLSFPEVYEEKFSKLFLKAI